MNNNVEGYDLLSTAKYVICYASNKEYPLVGNSILTASVLESSDALALQNNIDRILKIPLVKWLKICKDIYRKVRSGAQKILKGIP